MSNASDVPPAESDWPPITPWQLLLFAGPAVVLAFLVSFLSWAPLTVLLLLAGLIAAGSAVALQPKSVTVLGWAAAIAAVASFAMDPEWDSARLVVRLLVMFALVAAFLVSLPALVARLYASRAQTEK